MLRPWSADFQAELRRPLHYVERPRRGGLAFKGWLDDLGFFDDEAIKESDSIPLEQAELWEEEL